MRVMGACSLGGEGHWRPLVPLLRAAVRAGHEVLVVAPASLREVVLRAGFAHTAGSTPPDEAIARIRNQLPVASTSVASVLGNREMFGRLAASAMLPKMRATCAEWMPDLILRDPAEYASAIVSEELELRVAQVACSLASVEWGSIDVAAPALEDHRRGLVSAVRSMPYLSAFPGSLDPSEFSKTLRFHDSKVAPTGRLPDWWSGSRSPLVYLTLGTVTGRLDIALGLYRTALQAMAQLDVRVLLTVGRDFDLRVLGSPPDNVHVERWIEQELVLANADLVVCHGGSGTVFGSLAAGVPVVVLPSFADQFRNGEIVASHALGAIVASNAPACIGSRVVLGDRDVDRIVVEVRHLLDDVSYRERTRLVAAEVRATLTVDQALEHLTTA